MLMGVFENFEPGYLAFVGVKLVGYCAAGYALNRAYANLKRHFLVVGLTRTLIGLAVGGLFGWAAFEIGDRILPASGSGSEVWDIWGITLDELAGALYIVALALIRLFEWRALIWIFYDRESQQRKKAWIFALCGVAWSFLLDVPAIIGVIATVGIHMC
jgi:hypothetical protein